MRTKWQLERRLALYADREEPDASLVLGSAKHIRSDEWQVQTAWILSQAAQKPSYPLINPAVGDGPAPLICSLPVRHWSILFRPQFLGFFFLKLEQAFAIYWNFKWYALVLGAFLFFHVATHGKSLLALAGAFFIFFSGFTQWWFSSPTMMPEMVGMFFFALWATAIIFRTSSRWVAVCASLVLLFAIEQFAFCCYPRFQIPLIYLGIFILIGGAVQHYRHPTSSTLTIASQLSLLAGTLIAACALLYCWYSDVGNLLGEIRRLIYPGQVFSTGGAFLWFWFVAPFLEFGMTEHHFPPGMGNSCEAAGYLFVLPVLLAVIIREASRRRFDPLLIASTAFVTLLLLFMSIGVPLWLARWTGLSIVSSSRANIAMGIGSAIGLFRYLSGKEAPRTIVSPLPETLLFFALSVAFCWIFYKANTQMGKFVSVSSVIAVSLFFAAACLLLWHQRTAASCALLIVPLIYAKGATNPISPGLPGFTKAGSSEPSATCTRTIRGRNGW